MNWKNTVLWSFFCYLLLETIMIFIIFSPSFIALNCFIFGTSHFLTGISSLWNSFSSLLLSTSSLKHSLMLYHPLSFLPQFFLVLLFLLSEWYCAVLEHFACRALGSIHNSKCVHKEAAGHTEIVSGSIMNLLASHRSPGDALAIAKEGESSAGFHGLRFSSEDQNLKFSQHCYSFPWQWVAIGAATILESTGLFWLKLERSRQCWVSQCFPAYSVLLGWVLCSL